MFFSWPGKMCLFSKGGEENVFMVIFKIGQRKGWICICALSYYSKLQSYIYVSCFQTYNLKKVRVLTIWLSPIYVSLAVSVIVHGFQNRLALVKVCVELKCLGKKSFKNVLAYTLQQIYICNENIKIRKYVK